MTRVPLTKRERAGLKQQRRAGLAGNSFIDDFADDVDAIVQVCMLHHDSCSQRTCPNTMSFCIIRTPVQGCLPCIPVVLQPQEAHIQVCAFDLRDPCLLVTMLGLLVLGNCTDAYTCQTAGCYPCCFDLRIKLLSARCWFSFGCTQQLDFFILSSTTKEKPEH